MLKQNDIYLNPRKTEHLSGPAFIGFSETINLNNQVSQVTFIKRTKPGLITYLHEIGFATRSKEMGILILASFRPVPFQGM
jgi:hypothetical protein